VLAGEPRPPRRFVPVQRLLLRQLPAQRPDGGAARHRHGAPRLPLRALGEVAAGQPKAHSPSRAAPALPRESRGGTGRSGAQRAAMCPFASLPQMSGEPRHALAPLAPPTFRALWIASVGSHIASYMTDVGQGWLMTMLAPSPILVALLLTAESLPFFLLGL